MKIGFFMGSFDPIHIGHVNLIREALNFLDKVIVVPSGHNPWKKDITPAPFELRMNMISESIKHFGDKVEVSGIESTFEPPYYANKPLNYFKNIYKDDELYIICGTDTVEKIPYWKNAVIDILPFYRLLCLERDENITQNGNVEITKTIKDKEGKEHEYLYIPIHPISISSTHIRALVKNNKILYPLVEEAVEKIIYNNSLYR